MFKSPGDRVRLAMPMIAPPQPPNSEWQHREHFLGVEAIPASSPAGSQHAGSPRSAQKKRVKRTQLDAQLELDDDVGCFVPDEAHNPLLHARCCIGGLLAVELLRLCAVHEFPSPGGLAWTAHMLSCAADLLAGLGSVPVFLNRALGSCVNNRCLGSLLTLLLTAATCDWGAAVIYLVPAGGYERITGPALLDEGAPDVLSFLGVWECIMLSSISLQMALCLSAWRFYRAFREAGIYPPNATKAKIYKEVSAFEFLCEAEDVALLSDQCHAQCHRGDDTMAPQVSDLAFAEQHGVPDFRNAFTPAVLREADVRVV